MAIAETSRVGLWKQCFPTQNTALAQLEKPIVLLILSEMHEPCEVMVFSMSITTDTNHGVKSLAVAFSQRSIFREPFIKTKNVVLVYWHSVLIHAFASLSAQRVAASVHLQVAQS